MKKRILERTRRRPAVAVWKAGREMIMRKTFQTLELLNS